MLVWDILLLWGGDSFLRERVIKEWSRYVRLVR